MILRPTLFALTVLLIISGCTFDFTPQKNIGSIPTSSDSQDSDNPRDSDSQNSDQSHNSDQAQDSGDPRDTLQDSETGQTEDACPNDPNKTEPGICGCGSPERDCDGDGIVDCKQDCQTESISTTASVSSSSDDAEEALIGNSSFAVGHIELTSSDLEMTNDVEYHGSEQIIGLRFPNLQVPQKAAIHDAYVEFVADASNSEATALFISLEASDNGAPFSSTSFNLSNRPEVTTVIAWNDVPLWSIGSRYKTPTVASALQEVVNRGGWKSGNAVIVLVKGTGIREAVAYDQNPKDAATLHVTYR